MSAVWFVTGASSGIGTAIVKAALAAGHRVVATARNVEKLRSVLASSANDRLELVQLDVTVEAQARTAVTAAVEKLGRVDVLVNNAGYSLLGTFESFTAEQIERQLMTNFFGATYLMRAVLPVMRRQRAGHILNISSTAGLVGLEHCSAYAASKFALEGLSLSVAKEVEKLGIKITIVEPGFFRTDLIAPHAFEAGTKVVEGYDAPAQIQATWAGYNQKQTGDPAKLAQALIQLTTMESPPKQFLGGKDAIDMVVPALEAHLAEIRAYATLSSSTDL
jgi:NAD(P)-dependent dehydrogenase (short-subunit alcohol dehydrogenase family)